MYTYCPSANHTIEHSVVGGVPDNRAEYEVRPGRSVPSFIMPIICWAESILPASE